MLNLVIGGHNTGKTYCIKQKIKELLNQNDDKKIFLLVAEQCSFATEKDLLEDFGEKLANRINLISFSRLSHLLESTFGNEFSQNYPDDISKGIIMKLVLHKIKNELKIYASSQEKPKILNMLLDFIAEMNVNAITPEQLMKFSVNFGDTEIGLKLHDISIIFENYRNLLSDSSFAPFDELTGLYYALSDTNFFNSSHVFVDTFSGFTTEELNIIKLIISQAVDTTLTLPIDEDKNYDNSELFYRVKKILNSLKKFSDENKIHYEITKCDYNADQNKYIKFLSQNIFRFNGKKCNENPDGIYIYNADNYSEECEYVAMTISRLVKEEGYRYKDFAVVLRNDKNYDCILDTFFEKYNIPFFVDKRINISLKPAMLLVNQIFKVISKSFSTEEIFTYLKTGLTNINSQDIALLENYVYLWQIEGSEWKSDFVGNPRGFSHKFGEDEKKELEKLNDIRAKIITPFLELKEKSKNLTGDKMVEQLYDFIEKINLCSNLKNFCDELKIQNQDIPAKQELRTWGLLTDILDKLYLSLKDIKISISMFSSIVDTAVSFADMASIPQSLDGVNIIMANRNKGVKSKIAFVMGLNEKDFPLSELPGGILSNYQREKLIEQGLEINSSIELLSVQEQFIAYETVSMPKEKIYMSFVNSDNMSEQKSESSIIREVLRLFPKIKIYNRSMLSIYDFITEPVPGFEVMAERWNKKDSFSETLKNYYKNDDIYKNKLEMIEFSETNKSFAFNSVSNAKNFFKKFYNLSASQAEKYYSCPFSYFCKYGLGIKERKQAKVDALEYGNIIHYILENIFKNYSVNKLYDLDYNELYNIVSFFIDTYIKNNLSGWDKKSERFIAQAKRWAHTCCVVIRYMLDELIHGDFEPLAYELKIGKDNINPLIIKLPNGENIELSGKIDRVDAMPKNDMNYIRIIDYKTGKKDFNLYDIFYGVNIQMFVYMTALLKNAAAKNKDILPAAILYVGAKKPIKNIDERNNIDTGKKNVHRLDIKGVVLNNDSVIDGMDKNRLGEFIPLKYAKDGTVQSNNSIEVLNQHQMNIAMQTVENLIADMFIKLNEGNISPMPLKDNTSSNGYDACKWCEYKSVCHYEDNMKTRQLFKMSRKDSLEKLSQKNEGL